MKRKREEAPVPRKKAKKQREEAEEEEEEVQETETKTYTEETLWELGGKKKIRVGRFKGKTYVHIREYYEDKNSGEEKPGKGTSLNIEQWNEFLKCISEVKEAVKQLS